MFEDLEDEDLLQSYKKAIRLNLEKDFIMLLEKALVARGLLHASIDGEKETISQ